VEHEDLDAVPERSVPDSPVDVGTAHMEAPIDREVLARLRGLQGEDEPDIVAELAGMFLEDARSRLEAVEEALQKDDAPAVERWRTRSKVALAVWAQGGCSASARSWRTLARQDISRRASNCSDGSGRSWSGSRGRWKQRFQVSGEVVPAGQALDRLALAYENDIGLGDLPDQCEGDFDVFCHCVQDRSGGTYQEFVVLASCCGEDLGVAFEGFCKLSGIVSDG
jgi:hypothetical protein